MFAVLTKWVSSGENFMMFFLLAHAVGRSTVVRSARISLRIHQETTPTLVRHSAGVV